MNVMLDLETLSTQPNASIVAIGAVYFDNKGVYDTFYRAIDPQSSAPLARHIEPRTVMWWLAQDKAAQEALYTGENVDILTALDAFSVFYFGAGISDGGGANVWGNGAGFDNVILRSSYDAANTASPWGFRNDRCFRTLVGMLTPAQAALLWAKNKQGTAHNALDDAVSQAKVAVDVCEQLGISL